MDRDGIQTITWTLAAGLGAGLVCLPSVAGPEWEEPAANDAGTVPSNGQVAAGAGPLSKITGSLDGLGPGGDFQDMYLIRITSPSSFTASLDPAGFDTQLWLLDAGGLGLLGNDDISAVNTASAFGPAADDGTGAVVSASGLYYIAVSGFDGDPVSPSGAIYDQFSSIEVSGPDGPGGSLPISGWTAAGATGAYEIILTGAAFPCLADLTGPSAGDPPDGVINVFDLLLLLANFGHPPGDTTGDITGPLLGDGPDGVVNVFDLLALLALYGETC